MMSKQKSKDYLSVEKIIQRIYETTNEEKLDEKEITANAKEYAGRWRVPVTNILKAIEDETPLSENKIIEVKAENIYTEYDYQTYENYIKWMLMFIPYYKTKTIINNFIRAKKNSNRPENIKKELLVLFKTAQNSDFHHNKLRDHLKENIISEKVLDNYTLLEKMLAGEDAKLLENTLRSVSSGITLGDKHYLTNLTEREAKILSNRLDYVHWLILRRLDYKAIKILEDIKQASARQNNAKDTSINILSQRFYWLKAIAEFRIEEDKEFKQMLE